LFSATIDLIVNVSGFILAFGRVVEGSFQLYEQKSEVRKDVAH